MRKEQKDIDRLGPIGIFREAFKLWSAHSKMFMLNQLTLVLPLAILAAIFQCVMYSYMPEPNNNAGAQAGAAHIPHLPSSKLGLINFSGSNVGLMAVVSILVLVVISCIAQAAGALAWSTSLYAVGLHYTGQSVSFQDVLRASIPRLWARLTVTNFYILLLIYAMVLIQTFAAFQLLLLKDHLAVALWGVAALSVIVMVGMVCLSIVLVLAGPVSVLEKDYGWAAMRTALKLLKGRVMVALLFRVLFAVPGFITAGFAQGMKVLIVKGDSSLGSRAALLILVVAYICWATFFSQLGYLCYGVQYVSFKAFHTEDLEESFYKKQTMKAGYEPVAGAETDDVRQEEDSFA